MKAKLFSLFALALLGACSANQPADKPQTAATPVANTQAADVFQCQNGLEVQIQVLNDDQIRLSSGGQSAVMDRAVSGSGVRYVAKTGLFGSGGEWHEKGGNAIFTYGKVHGGKAEVSCSKN